MNSDTCPRKDDLVAYALGKLGDDLIDTVSGHLESCPDCLATVQGVDDTQDSIFDILRRSTSRPVFHEEPECRAAIEAAQAAAKERDDGSPIDLADTSPLGRIRDYVLLKKIGEGGMGTVYAAMHSRLQRLVAIKTLTPGRSNNEQAVSRFLREMKAVGRLEHPNIVRAIDAGEADGTYFLAFEYIEGVDLSCLIRAAGPLSVADACEIVRQAADALQAVHDHGLVHRDVKPSNLMLTVDGAVKLLDLGLAVWHAEQMDDADITATGHVLGTLEYVAPEQAMDVHDVDIRADIYSLGCTLYALLVGHPPFQRSRYRSPIQILMAHGMAPVPPIQELRPELPATLLPVLNRMLAKQTDDRFGTPKEVNKALAEFARGTDLKTLFGSISCIGDKFDINQWPALCGELHRAGTPIPRAVDSPALAVPTNHRHHRVKTIAIAVVVAAIVVGLWHFRPELVRTSASHSHSGDIDDSDATNDSASLESRSNTDASRQFPSGAPWLP
jgi:serine/threonine protein kinase